MLTDVRIVDTYWVPPSKTIWSRALLTLGYAEPHVVADILLGEQLQQKPHSFGSLN